MFEIQHVQFKSARWWLSRQGQIDFSPAYQRKSNLWKLQDQQSLIDTMVNGYDMPKLYLADFTTIKSQLNESGTRYAVIDGKQRLEAIFGFLRNLFPLSENFVLTEDPSIRMAGLYYKDLVENFYQFAEHVEEFPLPIVHVVTDDAVRIRELFLRLNKGLVLTGPEKRNAMNGVVPDAINSISEHEFFGYSTAYASSRGQHQNNAAKLLAFELYGGVTDTKKVYLDKMVERFAGQEGEVEYATIKVQQNLDKLSIVFGRKDRLLRSAGSIPAFFWFIRDIDVDQIKFVRPFLESFYFNLTQVGDEQDQTHLNVYSEYKRGLRSINDRWSHELRLSVLQNQFQEWLNSGHRDTMTTLF
ncbi:DUF262 domain-containing protein [Thalassospira lucentensis]|uniref:DUF262 domain-containing protein n=1 Tax=Thalassospira lucentensis TaxID=168935 RepID=UPI003D2BB998